MDSLDESVGFPRRRGEGGQPKRRQDSDDKTATTISLDDEFRRVVPLDDEEGATTNTPSSSREGKRSVAKIDKTMYGRLLRRRRRGEAVKVMRRHQPIARVARARKWQRSQDNETTIKLMAVFTTGHEDRDDDLKDESLCVFTRIRTCLIFPHR